jgi:hypothetical protein
MLLSKHAKTKIFEDINEAPFFSIIIDTIRDISKIDQMSIVFRYVKIIKSSENIPVDIKIFETFTGFYETHDHTASGLKQLIIKELEEKSISISKCVGQGYERANVMSGNYNGLQAKLKNREKNADYIHCASHNLNFVLNDAVNGISESVNFFEVVEYL